MPFEAVMWAGGTVGEIIRSCAGGYGVGQRLHFCSGRLLGGWR